MADEAAGESFWIAIVALAIIVLLLLSLVCCYYAKKRNRPLIRDAECGPPRQQQQVATNVKTSTNFSASPPLQGSLLKQAAPVNNRTTDMNDMPARLERALEAPFIDETDTDGSERCDKSDAATGNVGLTEVGHIVPIDKDVRLNKNGGGSNRRKQSKGRTMSLLTPELYGSVRAPHSADAEVYGENDDVDVDNRQSKRRSPRPVITLNEPIVFGEHEVLLDVLHLTSLDEIVVTVKRGRMFDPTQTYAMLVTVENSATQKSRTLETAHIGGLEELRWNEQIVFGGIKESCLEDVTITVVVIRKDANDLWEDEGHIVLSEISPHSSGRTHFMQMMAKDGSAMPKWHRVAVNLP